jgi:hypothetical protein
LPALQSWHPGGCQRAKSRPPLKVEKSKMSLPRIFRNFADVARTRPEVALKRATTIKSSPKKA